MGRKSAGAFVIGIFAVGAFAAGSWVQKNTGLSSGFVIIPSLIVLIALSLGNYHRPMSRRRKWRPRIVTQQRRSYDRRSRTNGWNQPQERQYPAWAVYVAAAIIMAGTFSAVFFWPTNPPSEAASYAPSAPLLASPKNAAAGNNGSEAKSSPAAVRPAPFASSAQIPHRLMQIPSNRFLCNVSSITDGDTLRCSDGRKIRLHAVAARESDEICKTGHPCPSASAASATAMLSQLASGQTLQCEPTGTSYGRVTAICWNQESAEINCAMVNSGTALLWPKFNKQRAICN